MFSHMMVGADDVEKAKVFYDATLGALGYEAGTMDEKGRCWYMTESGMFAITPPINGEAATAGNGCTIGFAAKDSASADAWHAAGVANGGTTCEEPPGKRESGLGDLYLAYLRDPYGNKLCALHPMG
ncbi:MAG: VOC family protein [Gammaproteobacteria bacterium]